MAAPPFDRDASQAPCWQPATGHPGFQAANAPTAVLPPRAPSHAPALIDSHNIQRLMLSREQLLAAVPLEQALKDGGLSLLQGLVVRFKRVSNHPAGVAHAAHAMAAPCSVSAALPAASPPPRACCSHPHPHSACVAPMLCSAATNSGKSSA